MPLTLADLPEEIRGNLGAVRRLVLPVQGMTSDVAIVETDDCPLVVKRAQHPLFARWLAEEYRVLQALEPLALPVPRPHQFLQRTTSEGDECWLVMDYLPGIPLAETLGVERDPELRRHIVMQWGAVLALIHAMPAPPELAPRAGSWLEDRLEQARYNLAHYPVDGDAELLRYVEVHRPPPVRQTLIHGDFTLDNTLIHDGTITGVIDWGFGALGDPRYDLALALDPDPGVFDAEADRAAFLAGYGPAIGSEDDYHYFLRLYEFF